MASDRIYAWVFVVESGTTIHVAEEIKRELGFEGTNLYGIYDAVVLTDALTLQELKTKVWKIGNLPAVATTVTFVVMGREHKETKEKPTAYILTDTTPKLDETIQEKVSRIEQVTKCDIVLGPNNMVIEVVTKSEEDLKEVLSKLLKIEGIVKTSTMPCFC